jgi:hypothetical protein
MATKKTSTKKGGKPRRKDIPDEDPPVVVGGGNSVDITFDAGALGVSDPDPKRKKFRQKTDIISVVIDDGFGTTRLIRVDPKKFQVSFFS